MSKPLPPKAPSQEQVQRSDAAGTTSSQETVLDLRELFKAIGSVSPEPALGASLAERPWADTPVEMLESSSTEVTEKPMDIAGVVDGVQSTLCLTYREHRPVYLAFTAAGCAGPSARLLGIKQRLGILCSSEDEQWARSLPAPVHVTSLQATEPWDIERAASEAVSGTREEMERSLVVELLAQGTSPLLVDGSLLARPASPQLVGVVKDTSRRYLSDESPLLALQEGWRSAAFRIPAGSQGSPKDRFSCYVRLFKASGRRWNFGLVRLESLDLSSLGALAARALAERQSAASGDARWDRHLSSVRTCEELLRALRPPIFSVYRR